MSTRMESTTTTTTTTMTSYDWSSSVRLLAPTEDELREVGAIGRVLARKSVIWARESIERLPIRLNLESVGVLTVLMALIIPRPLTYALMYPLFRLVFGTLYPAYASYKAVRTKNVKEYVKWMMYWIVFALFTCAETFTDVFFSFWFPFYYEIKIILVLWLLSPATKGSSILYRRFVHPALCRREAEIDDALARATEQGYTAVLQLGSKGVNYATTVLMQTAIKNLPTVMPSGTLAASQSDSAISSLANPRASPSRSETDGTTKPRRRPQRRTKSEDDVGSVDTQIVEIIDKTSPSDSDDVEYLDMDFMPTSAGETTTDSVDISVDFKKPEPASKKQKPASKGGGGLVQQLRKSYSLSDLTGEKEDENRNTECSPDEVDMDEPRRRETRGRRGYSPRRTQSSSNRVDMYFSEVDVEVRQSRSRDPVGSLTNIKSSDDISSGYSSGEALQSQRSSITGGEHLVRTASVGARNRTKPRTTTKKSPEGDEGQEEEIECIEQQQSLTINPLSLLNPQQTLELFSFLAEHKDYLKMIQHQQNLSDSDDDSSTLKADPPGVTIEEIKKSDSLGSVIDVKLEEEKLKGEPQDSKLVIDVNKINNEMCSPKLDELKELLKSANKAVATIVSSQENLHQLDNLSSDNTISIIQKTSNTLEIKTSPSISRSNSDWDCSERAGKYNKKPAPKAPETAKDEKEEREEKDVEEEKALKATLVIKTGTVKSFTGHEAVDAVVKRRKKNNAKTAARESFSKLLTIPKNIFHNAFHKDKDEDAKSVSSEKSRSRSGSYENVKREVDVTNVLLSAANDQKKDSNEGDTYISLRSDSIDCDITTPQTSNSQEVTSKAISEEARKEETIV